MKEELAQLDRAADTKITAPCFCGLKKHREVSLSAATQPEVSIVA